MTSRQGNNLRTWAKMVVHATCSSEVLEGAGKHIQRIDRDYTRALESQVLSPLRVGALNDGAYAHATPVMMNSIIRMPDELAN